MCTQDTVMRDFVKVIPASGEVIVMPLELRFVPCQLVSSAAKTQCWLTSDLLSQILHLLAPCVAERLQVVEDVVKLKAAQLVQDDNMRVAFVFRSNKLVDGGCRVLTCNQAGFVKRWQSRDKIVACAALVQAGSDEDNLSEKLLSQVTGVLPSSKTATISRYFKPL